MRNKTLRLIMTFPTTTDAMAMESRCARDGVPGRLIPVPSAITSDCGMCWCAPPEARQQVEGAAEAGQIRVEGICEMMI